MDFQTSKSGYAELRELQRTSKDFRLYKKVTVLLMLHQGCEIGFIEQSLGIDDNTIRRYHQRYVEMGVEGLVDNRKTGRVSMLSESEQEELGAYLDDFLFSDVKSIVAYVHETYGVSYSIPGMTSLLHRKGFVFKQTTSIPIKADDEAQLQFLTET